MAGFEEDNGAGIFSKQDKVTGGAQFTSEGSVPLVSRIAAGMASELTGTPPVVSTKSGQGFSK